MATILIVDDLPGNRTLLMAQLRDQGHRFLEAADGRAALAAAKADRPDLVITDVLMPAMDGFELVRQLRLSPATRRIPVVFCTAHYSEREARALAESGGVADVLTKPVEAGEVLAIVGRVLSGASTPPIASAASVLTPAFDREHLRLVTDKLSMKAGDLKTSNARLRALINIGLELASERDSDRLLHRVCAATRDLFGATTVTLGIVEARGRTVQTFIVCGTDDGAPWLAHGDTLPAILATVVDERRPARGVHTGGDPARAQLPLLDDDVLPFLITPIASPTVVYGWICLTGHADRTFTENDEHLVTALSGLVGRIYENGCFSAVAQRRADELECEILERQQAESALRVERDRAQQYLNTADVILLALDLEGQITSINRKGCDLLGWTERELLGRVWIETCLPERIRDTCKTLVGPLVGGLLPVNEHPVITKAGEERLIEWRNTLLRDDAGQVTGTLSSGTDITDRRLLEEQYQQAQKMEAIGRLAGSVAHDFNNLLTVILGNCELLMADIEPPDRRRDDIVEIQKAGTSAAGLTHQLLAFSRKEIIEATVLDLNEVVGNMRGMLERLIGEDVKVILNLGPRPAVAKADRGQVAQIVMNLAVNARDAMPKGGTLTIATASVELAARAATHCTLAAGPYVVLSVSDTGTGITPEVQARLFEPFFTTKAPGKGTGLGLATVHGIAAQSGGSVGVRSVVGKGTSFVVYFPRVDAAPIAPHAPPPVHAPRAGTQTVLVVDDADGVCVLAKRLLERQGYTVLIASNVDEAVRLFEQHASIDLLLTDVVMPVASGPELAKRLHARRPGLKVIYMSGYTAETISHHGIVDHGVAFLHKPFSADTLGRTVRDALERA
ncbi:MAG TPA: response regulator [Vicinamibacterales bacterium]|nr:response regulator [Vicinamibacterales bacterium]